MLSKTINSTINQILLFRFLIKCVLKIVLHVLKTDSPHKQKDVFLVNLAILLTIKDNVFNAQIIAQIAF